MLNIMKKQAPQAIVISKEGEAPASEELLQLVMKGWYLKEEIQKREAVIKDLKASLLESNNKIKGHLKAGEAIKVAGVCRVTVANRETITISDAEQLKGIIGPRFQDLVESKQTVKHTPTKKLLAMASDPDSADAMDIRALLDSKISTSVTYRSAPVSA